MNTLQKLEAKNLEQAQTASNLPEFTAGDTVKVNVKIREGTRERVQAYEGVCIARTGNGMNASFTVRKISYGEGVERVFPLYSPRIDSVELVRRGSVRRAKLYYLRELRGKKARISERTTGHGIEDDAAEREAAKKERQAAKSEAKKAKAEKKKERKTAKKDAPQSKAKQKKAAKKKAD